jgi:FkbH-like protein
LKNKELGDKLSGKGYNVSVISNITINQVKEILEFKIRETGIRAECKIGNYDNILQDAAAFKESQLVVIFWELANIVDGLQYKAELLGKEKTEELINKVTGEIGYVFNELKDTSHILINKFSSLLFNHANIDRNNLDLIADKLNDFLYQNTPKNATIIDVDRIYAKLSVERCVDFRYYYSSKALYTIDFFRAYSDFVLPVVRALNGKAKKALIFDCDNTLWKGIVGEDGFDQIALSSLQRGGTPYEEVQTLARALAEEGILLGICSKNNPADVDEVLNSHDGMVIKDDDLTIKRVNWSDKVSNLKSIAKTLNIGLDSFVFVDDSDFEVNLIKENLPDVTTLQVPAKTFLYPELLRKNLGLFYNVSKTKEDVKRVAMYKEQAKREEAKSNFDNLEAYIKSLSIKAEVFVDNKSIVPRMSQMTQKTNQFNLTTKRYAEADITRFVEDEKTMVVAVSVSDKFGDSGITGLSIVCLDNDTAEIDTLLLSCRIIGRRIELLFIDYLVEKLRHRGVKRIKSKYLKTLKNKQVETFYDNLGFKVVDKTEDSTDYEVSVDDYQQQEITFIEIIEKD